jgi:hypothetical protein
VCGDIALDSYKSDTVVEPELDNLPLEFTAILF